MPPFHNIESTNSAFVVHHLVRLKTDPLVASIQLGKVGGD